MKIKATVINGRFVKPLDKDLFCKIAQKTGKIITVEENVIAGGFGSAVLEVLGERGIQGVRVKCLGISDVFVEHGSQDIGDTCRIAICRSIGLRWERRA